MILVIVVVVVMIMIMIKINSNIIYCSSKIALFSSFKYLGKNKALLFNILTATVAIPFMLWRFSTVAFATCPNAPFPMTFTMLILFCETSQLLVIGTRGM